MIIPFKSESNDKIAMLSIDWIVLTMAAFGLSVAVLTICFDTIDDIEHAVTLQISDRGTGSGYFLAGPAN